MATLSARLLLDEMWSPVIAEELKRRGYDVTSVVQRPDLRGQPDSAVFRVALLERMAVVTEDVAGYRTLGNYEIDSGRVHFGLIFTSPRTFPRREPRTLGRMISALAELLDSEADLRNREHWLTPS